MEKPKRGHSRFRMIKLLTFTVLLIGFGIGIALIGYVHGLSSADYQTSSNVDTTDTTLSCALTQRAYPASVITNNGLNSVGSPNTGGGGNSAMGNIPVTSVASMNSAPTQPPSTNSNALPTMGSPATYTPMPTQQPTVMPPGMQVTPNQMNQPQITGTPVPNQQAINTDLQSRLSAGEIDDNAEWDVYMLYRDNFQILPANSLPVDDVDVSERQLIRVVNANGQPVLGAQVNVLSHDGTVIQTSCTYATGYTQFFPNAQPLSQNMQDFRVQVSKDGVIASADVQRSPYEWTLTLDVTTPLNKLDILFLIDATGSMDDEIAQLTNNILYISEQISALPDSINVRYGLVSYKDGSFPTEVWDFTHNVNVFQSQLAQLYTAGGDGETLNDGLDRALHAVQWRGDDTVKLVFLVGDEPPGIYENHPSYAISMLRAKNAGIKIHPIASSGLDIQGEYIFRQIAQTTMGHFIFLTYGAGETAIQGADTVTGSLGNDDVSGQYSVEQLHEIVLQQITNELMISSN